jgi:hypothetical protein
VEKLSVEDWVPTDRDKKTMSASTPCWDLADMGVADPDPGSGAFLTPGSEIGFFRIPDPKSILLRT